MVTSLGLGGTGLPVLASAQPGGVPDAPATGVDDAPTTKAAILPLVVEGDEMPDADRQQLAGRLVEGLERGDFEVISPDEVAALRAPLR